MNWRHNKVYFKATSAARVAVVLISATLAIAFVPGQSGHIAVRAHEKAVGNFTILDVPGASDTLAVGINNEGEIVGRYVDAQGKSHGYLLSEGEFSTIDESVFPGAVLRVSANGINDPGTIVGSWDSSDGVRHAFRLRDGQLLSLDPPGSTTLAGGPVGINNRGTIVGSYIGQDGHTHGFAFRKGEFSTIDVPNASDTFCNNINDKGEIVGGYRTAAIYPNFLGYILRGDKLTLIDRPEASLLNAIGINDGGSVVGRWRGADGVVHGYILRKGEFTDFDPPDFSNMPGEANGDEAHGINEVGQIVGYYRATDGRLHGYLLNRGKHTGRDDQ